MKIVKIDEKLKCTAFVKMRKKKQLKSDQQAYSVQSVGVHSGQNDGILPAPSEFFLTW